MTRSFDTLEAFFSARFLLLFPDGMPEFQRSLCSETVEQMNRPSVQCVDIYVDVDPRKLTQAMPMATCRNGREQRSAARPQCHLISFLMDGVEDGHMPNIFLNF